MGIVAIAPVLPPMPSESRSLSAPTQPRRRPRASLWLWFLAGSLTTTMAFGGAATANSVASRVATLGAVTGSDVLASGADPTAATEPRASSTSVRDSAAPASGVYEIPIEVLEGLVLARATLRGASGLDTTGWLLLDTGAGYLALDHAVARFVGIVDSTATYNQLEMADRHLSRLELGDLQMDQVGPALVFDAEIIRSVTDRSVLGLLGERTLTGFAARIDYAGQKLTLLPVPAPERAANQSRADALGSAAERVRRSRVSLASALRSTAIAVPYQRTDEGKMIVDGWVSDPKPPRRSTKLRWVIDTGASKAALFSGRVREMAPHAGEWPALRGLTSPTLIGTAEASVARVPRLEIEGDGAIAQASDIDVAIIDGRLGDALAQEVGAPVDGLLGYSFLRRFLVTLDLVNQVLWLEPVPHPFDDRPHEYSHIGAQIERRDDAIEVTGVAARSPADRAGVQRGDRITAIDGEPVAGADLNAVARKLEGPPGSRVRVTFRRDGMDRTLELVRRRLL
jgi:predicted aspartyl protease